GFVGRGLVARYGPIRGVLLTSFLFGLMHVVPRQVAYAAVMGVILHFTYLTTRSLLIPMLLHFLNNSLSVVATQLPSLYILNAEPERIPVLLYASALLLLGAVCLALYDSRARLVSH